MAVGLALLLTLTAYGIGLILAVPAVIMFAVSLGLIATLAFIARTELATFAVIAILYSNAAAVAVNVHGLPAFVGLAFPLLLAIPLGDRLLLRRESVVLTSAAPYLGAYLIFVLVSAAASARPSDTIDAVINFLVGGFGLYLVLTNVLRSIEILNRAIWVLLVVGAAMAGLSILQTLTGSYSDDYGGFAQIDLPGRVTAFRDSLTGTPRLAGPIGEVNRYSQVLMVLLPIGALFAFAQQRVPLRLAATAMTALILFGMAATFSRGAALGLLAMIAGGFVLRYVRPRHIVALVLVLVLALAAFPRYTERLTDLQALMGVDRTTAGTVEGDADNLRSRATSALAAFFAFVDHPVLGVGPGQFPANYHRYAGEVAAAAIDTRIRQESRQAHNLYTGIAAELGALGLGAFLAIFTVTMRDLIRARRRWLAERPELAHIASGFLLALIGYLVSGVGLHLSFERYLWLLLAMAGAAGHLALTTTPLTAGNAWGSLTVQPVGVAEDASEPRRLGR